MGHEGALATRAAAPEQVTTKSILVPAVSLRQEAVLRVLVLATVGAGAWFWLWWLAAGHGTWRNPLVVV